MIITIGICTQQMPFIFYTKPGDAMVYYTRIIMLKNKEIG